MSALTEAERRSLRRTARSFGLQTAALVLLVLAAMSATVLVVVDRQLRSAGEERIVAAARSIDDVHDAPPGMWVIVSDHGRVEASPNLPDGLPDSESLQLAVAAGGEIHQSVDTSEGRLPVVTVVRA